MPQDKLAQESIIQAMFTMFTRFAEGISPPFIDRSLRFALQALCICLAALAGETRAGGWQMKQPPLMTPWTSQVNTNTPLPEYPRPQMVRSNWLNLNGVWQFEPGITNTDPVPTNQTLSGSILVPYPMESAISGVMAYHAWSWYRTLFTIPFGWDGQRIILHLDAVTWQAQVYVNGHSVGIHSGGYDPISYDITSYLTGLGSQELIVQVWSPEDNGGQPRGKQTLYPGGIMYTSASGIWQPTWIEPAGNSGVRNLVIIPDVDNARLRLTVNTYASNGVTVTATVLSNTTVLQSTSGNPGAELDIPISNPNLWTPDNPFLYNLKVLVMQNAKTNDSVTSYFGMRKISTNITAGIPRIYLNNQAIFGMGPLDQGYWPDGIYTAPTDDALKFDLQEIKSMGFNTIRKHEKVECQRWYYWADTLGLMVWQDMPTCNSYTGNANPPAVNPLQFIAELSALVTNHWNSPSIIMWDIFNENQGEAGSSDGVGQTNTAYLVGLVKGLDSSRLVNQASGGAYFGVGDVLDNHNYPPPGNPTSTTQAAVDGEYGGIGLLVAGHLWNSGAAFIGDILATNTAAFATIYDSYSDDIVGFKPGGLNAAIETQIFDVENECDGLVTYDRVVIKPDPARIAISNQKAISGQVSIATVVPTSQTVPQTWQYTVNTNTASTNWYATDFNASGWSTGAGGFGTIDPGVTPNTPWNTPGYIWLRRTFNPGNLTPRQLSNLVFTVYHDEDVVIYINGVLAGQDSGYSTSYITLAMTPQAKAAIIPNATNVMAVSCYQTTGGQFIDVGINADTLTANTLTAPPDYVGYWNLDETNGTVAADSSGNGDNGTVNSATWNRFGKVNGCLSFNGVNNYVQVNREVSNDFSIAFWMQTATAGGTGTWRQGNGLVDGSVGAGTSDFGAALVGKQFAFGTGNPDTTLTSSSAVNDGLWHYCVATRVQSTGLIKLYVDGSLQANGTGTTQVLTAPTYLRFGAIQSGGGFFNGNLDEIKIYNRALGNLEIAALYGDGASPPGPPTNLTCVAGNGQVALNWWETPIATSYNVSRSLSSGGPYSIIANVSTSGYTDTNLVNGTTYYYVVSSVDSAGVSPNSGEVRALPFDLGAWFEASAITGLANGAYLSDWKDLSGNGNNATQTVASNQPIYVLNAMNGLPVARFNSNNSTYLSFNRPVQDDFTIIIVYQSTQNNQGTGTAFFQGAGLVNGDQPGAQNDFGTQLNANGQITAGTGNPDTSISSGGGLNDGRPHVVTFERTESTGALALYVDGLQVATGTGSTSPLTAPSQLDLGAVPSGGGFLNGDIAEVLVFDIVLTDDARAADENALKGKYGLSPGQAPATPSGLTGTADNRQIALGWSLVIGAGSYNLWRSTNNGATYQQTATGLATASYVDTNAVSGQTNYYEVTAVNSLGVSANSAPVGIFLPKPMLSAARADDNTLNIGWPAWAVGWDLYFATNLNPPVTWFAATNAIGSNGGQFNVALPINAGTRYFRLSSP
jgi:hypothetical protein